MAKKKPAKKQSDQLRDDARYVLQLVRSEGKLDAIEILRRYRLGAYDGASSPRLTIMVDGSLGFDHLRCGDEKQFVEMAGDSKSREVTVTGIHNQIRKYCISKGGEILREPVERSEEYEDEEIDYSVLEAGFPSYDALWNVASYINENFSEYGVGVEVPSADNDCKVSFVVPDSLGSNSAAIVQADIRSATARRGALLLMADRIDAARSGEAGFTYTYLFRCEQDIFGAGEELRMKWSEKQLTIWGLSPQVQYVNHMELMKLAASIHLEVFNPAKQLESWLEKTGLTHDKYFEMLSLARDFGLKFF